MKPVFAKQKAEGPTRIRSDIIDIKRKSQTINFINNVVVEKDDSSLLANKMEVLYNENKSSEGETSIRRINANENVRIFSEEFVASGDSGFYDPAKNIFVLESNVVVNNGTSIANGDKFIYDLTTKKGNFIGKRDETSIGEKRGDKRVTIIIGDEVPSQIKSRKKEGDNE